MEIKHCQNCGEKVLKNAKFCTECGFSLIEKHRKGKEVITENKYYSIAKKNFNDSYKKIINKNIDVTTQDGRTKLIGEIKNKVKDNKLKSIILVMGIVFLSSFIFSPTPQNVADKFIEYSAYDKREKALPLMSEEGKDYTMGMSRKEFETHPDYASYETVLRTRISRLTHNVARQDRELVSYNLLAEEKHGNGIKLTYQTIFDNGDMETPWIHLIKKGGRWKVFSFYQNSLYW